MWTRPARASAVPIGRHTHHFRSGNTATMSYLPKGRFLTKPFEPRRLVRELRKALDFKVEARVHFFTENVRYWHKMDVSLLSAKRPLIGAKRT